MFRDHGSSSSRRLFLASLLSIVAPPAVVARRSPRLGLRGREARRAMEAGKLSKHDLATPALLLDLNALEQNVARMAAHVKGAKRAIRPHAKTHKCPEIAKAQIAAGAAGICAATLHEAEVMAAHGIPGLLITSELVGKPKLKRLMKLAAAHRDLMVIVDSTAGVRELSEAASAARVDLNVLLDLDVAGRTGVAPGPPAVELAKEIARLPGLGLRGIQAYAGQASHTIGFENRREVSLAAMAPALETSHLLEKAGFEVPLLSGGSTGTYNIDSALEGVTELQPGSYVFMDVDYRRIGGQSGEVYSDFAPSLTVVATVISRPAPDVAILDAGLKAFSTDRSFGPECVSLRGTQYSWGGDEHGRLDLSAAEREVRLGDRLEFLIPHCDPSVNLYDRLYAVRKERAEAVWPIAARGYRA